ncbi:uncharacterized protein P884DRAFT_216539 [Thermothelomyces heterothallicus CBS 202.75]|uniref:uncharacterized protein n=1 Tax=Thermothelomyces heterothallicus CBS 202.75 TaxID=1149848 RepID=UPI0037439B6A
MLLTSAQVSLAVSSGIIFLCTAALFLSGYVIQQRTLRDLRAAIKPPPRPSPNIFLPDRFKHSAAELPDGTVVVLHDGQGQGHGQGDRHGDGEGAKRGRRRPLIVEVKPTRPPHGDAAGDPEPLADEQGQQPAKTAEAKSKDGEPGEQGRGEGDTTRAPTPAAADADRGADERQKPMSRAERRRRIRAEIMRMSRGQKQQQQQQQRGYYRRRFW